VVSAWYPHSLHEAEGDFIKHQAMMMRSAGMDISVIHVSMSIRYLLTGMWRRTVTKTKGELPETIIEKPFWPRNSSWGIDRWATSYVKEIKSYCDVYGLPDLIWTHTYLGGYVGTLLKMEYDIPLVCTLHESMIMDQSIPSYHIPLLKQALTHSDQIVSVGHQLKNQLAGYTTSQDIKVIPNFIDFELFRPSPDKHQTFTYIYIGEFIPRKRIHLIIREFGLFYEKHKNVRLLCIGDGPLLSDMVELAQKSTARSAITFTGRLSQTEVADQLAKSHCLLLLSEAETFGIVLAESMACGIPFICSINGAPEGILNHEYCHFIESENIQNAMEQCYQNRNTDISNQLRGAAKAHFSADVVISQYQSLFQSLITSK